MRAFSKTELARMQSGQQAAMQDRCDLLSHGVTGTDDHGMPIEGYTVVVDTVCGFDPSVAKEVMDKTEVALTDARVRLPLALDDQLDSVDRVRITERFGVPLNAALLDTYQILGAPERGPSGLVLNLQLVTDGSDT